MLEPAARTPPLELQRRIAALQKHLVENQLDGALILQNSDLFYFAGTIQQSHLYIPVDDDPLLMVRKSFQRATSESALARIVPINSPKELLDRIRSSGLGRPRRIGMELDVLPVNLYRIYETIFGEGAIEDLSPQIRQVRACKSDYELALIRAACRLADQVSATVPELLRVGATEVELAGQVEAAARKLGHQGIIRMRLWGSELFYGHLMAGATAAIPSYLASPTGGRSVSAAVAQGASDRSIRRNEPILLDYVFAHQGYLADHTRIFCIGEIDDRLTKAHQQMLAIQAQIMSAAKPGVMAGELYQTALTMAEDAGLGEYFMGSEEKRIRFIGHGVGVELDEFPFLAKGQTMPLAAGMVIALEPKAIFPGLGVVGIENTHVVTPSGLQRLTNAPDEIHYKK